MRRYHTQYAKEMYVLINSSCQRIETYLRYMEKPWNGKQNQQEKCCARRKMRDEHHWYSGLFDANAGLPPYASYFFKTIRL